VIPAQADIDVGVVGADDARVVVDLVDRAWRNAQAVNNCLNLARRNDAANVRFDRRDLLGRILDPGTDGGADMKRDLACIHRWEEIRTQEREKQERHQDSAEKPRHKQPSIIERQRQEVAISLTRVLKAGLETALQPRENVIALRLMHGVVGLFFIRRSADVRLQQIHRQGGNQGAREEE